MTDVTGALLSRQVRREIERKKSKNVVLTVKPDYLKDLCSQAVAKEAAKHAMAIDGILKPAKKPDADNILKLGLDALNGVAYADDKQVISCECIKAYAETPQMVITVSEMKV